MNNEQQIIKNLRGRVYPVNIEVATFGTDENGFDTLNELINRGLVEMVQFERGSGLYLYRLVPFALEKLIENQELTNLAF